MTSTRTIQEILKEAPRVRVVIRGGEPAGVVIPDDMADYLQSIPPVEAIKLLLWVRDFLPVQTNDLAKYVVPIAPVLMRGLGGSKKVAGAFAEARHTNALELGK